MQNMKFMYHIKFFMKLVYLFVILQNYGMWKTLQTPFIW